jgi:hypothetical protein
MWNQPRKERPQSELPPIPPAPTVTPQLKEAMRALGDLEEKRQLSLSSNDVYWSASDQAEWQKYHDVIYK